MMIATRSTSASLLIVALAFAAPAHAQIAEAEALFREGKRLMKLGQTAQACDKFDASERLEPTDGTEINLANCREKNGQLATAWAMFAKAAAGAKRSGHTEREAEARRRAAELEPRLVYLTIVVPEASRITGLVVKRNDTAIDRALWDQSVPVDPDEYQISGEAPGHESWSTSVVVKTKSKKVEVPVLDKRPDTPSREVAAAPSEPRDAGKADLAVAAAPSRFTPRRKLAIATAAVGVVAVGVGIGFGLHGSSLADDADALCPNVDCNNAHAVDLNHSARSDALVANIGFAVGGAAIAGAAVLWLIGAPRAGETVSVVPTLGADRIGIGFARSF
jgi:tetratricopeptide (TPR) repeat protein